MQHPLGLIVLVLIAVPCVADDDAPAPAGAPGAPLAAAAPITQTVEGQESVHYATEARWAVAGYNNEEIVYTILITNKDTRILRCATQLKGSYYENGKKLDIADRQSSTVFPGQQVQVGNWLGMDRQSGATYAVKCRALE